MNRTHTNPSPRLLRACARFGMAPDCPQSDAQHRRAQDAASALMRLAPGQLAFITGPSGSGKSLILRQLAARLRPRTPVIHVDPLRPPAWRPGSLIDQFPGPLADALSALARAGLGDATLLAAAPHRLSEGERHRLLIALAMHRAQRARAAFLLIDELASPLDRPLARNLARTLARWLRTSSSRTAPRPQCRIVCAAACDDLLEPLNPDVLIYQPLHLPALIVTRREPRT
jgi:ABC-type ATPase with predicted acetyltransferase domain